MGRPLKSLQIQPRRPEALGRSDLLLAPEEEVPIRQPGEFLDRVLCPGIAPTAILTYDMYAGELIRQLGERGLAVPRDVSLVGYDDDTHGAPSPLPLTTFRQDFETMAKVALSLLEARIKERNKPVQVVAVEGALIIRASTAPAATGATLKQEERCGQPVDRKAPISVNLDNQII